MSPAPPKGVGMGGGEGALVTEVLAYRWLRGRKRWGHARARHRAPRGARIGVVEIGPPKALTALLNHFGRAGRDAHLQADKK